MLQMAMSNVKASCNSATKAQASFLNFRIAQLSESLGQQMKMYITSIFCDADTACQCTDFWLDRVIEFPQQLYHQTSSYRQFYNFSVDYQHQGVQLKEAQELLASSQSELREARGMYVLYHMC